MTTLYLAWQDPETRRWHTVGRLEQLHDAYCFCYTKGARQAPRFVPFGRMLNLTQRYYSRELFPLFMNRILHKGRPEYQDYLRWLKLEEGSNPLLLLARSGGVRATDLLEVFPKPERGEEGYYTLHFFSHGLRHLPLESRQCSDALQAGACLDLVPEPDNGYDELAIALHDSGRTKVGYCPRYFLPDLQRALRENAPYRLQVAQVNPDAPLQLRLLCQLRLKPTFDLFSSAEFEPESEPVRPSLPDVSNALPEQRLG